MDIDKRILKNVAPDDIPEVIKAERETIEQEKQLQEEYEAYLATLTRHQRHNLKRRAKKACEQAFDRASAKKAAPHWVTKENPEILAMYELAVAIEKVRRIQHSVDHRIPLKGICRKTELAFGVRKWIVCGLHVPDNLEVIPLSINRDIKKDWFDSDWPAWPVEKEEQSAACQDLYDEADPFGPIPDDGDDKIPF